MSAASTMIPAAPALAGRPPGTGTGRDSGDSGAFDEVLNAQRPAPVSVHHHQQSRDSRHAAAAREARDARVAGARAAEARAADARAADLRAAARSAARSAAEIIAAQAAGTGGHPLDAAPMPASALLGTATVPGVKSATAADLAGPDPAVAGAPSLLGQRVPLPRSPFGTLIEVGAAPGPTPGISIVVPATGPGTPPAGAGGAGAGAPIPAQATAPAAAPATEPATAPAAGQAAAATAVAALAEAADATIEVASWPASALPGVPVAAAPAAQPGPAPAAAAPATASAPAAAAAEVAASPTAVHPDETTGPAEGLGPVSPFSDTPLGHISDLSIIRTPAPPLGQAPTVSADGAVAWTGDPTGAAPGSAVPGAPGTPGAPDGDARPGGVVPGLSRSAAIATEVNPAQTVSGGSLLAGQAGLAGVTGAGQPGTGSSGQRGQSGHAEQGTDGGTSPVDASRATAPVAPSAPAAATTAPAPAPAGQAAAQQPLINQILDHLTKQQLISGRTLRDGSHRAVIRLNPDHLGAVTVSLDVRSGQVRLDLAAGAQALSTLGNDLGQLHASFAESGLHLADVTLSAQSPGGQAMDAGTGQPAPRREPWPAPSGAPGHQAPTELMPTGTRPYPMGGGQRSTSPGSLDLLV